VLVVAAESDARSKGPPLPGPLLPPREEREFIRHHVTKRAVLRRRAVLPIAGAFAVALVVGFFSAERLLCVDAGPREAEVIVVLGGESVDRVKQARELFARGAAPKIIVSGSGDCKFIRDELLRSGVPATALELEPRSRSTKVNAELTAPLLKKAGVKRAILVTSWFHSRRALNSFHRFAPEIQFSSAPAYHRETWPAKAIHVFQEYAKTLWYSVRHRILPWSARTP